MTSGLDDVKKGYFCRVYHENSLLYKNYMDERRKGTLYCAASSKLGVPPGNILFNTL